MAIPQALRQKQGAYYALRFPALQQICRARIVEAFTSGIQVGIEGGLRQFAQEIGHRPFRRSVATLLQIGKQRFEHSAGCPRGRYKLHYFMTGSPIGCPRLAELFSLFCRGCIDAAVKARSRRNTQTGETRSKAPQLLLHLFLRNASLAQLRQVRRRKSNHKKKLYIR